MLQNSNIKRIRLRLIDQFVEMRYYLLRAMNRCKYNFN
jgi:hypothetical protein